MNTVSIVTSCSAPLWKEYGFKCVQSLVDFLPPEVTLHLVSEDSLDLSEMRRVGHGRLMFWPLSNSAMARVFYEKNKDNDRAKGLSGHKPHPTRAGPYDFRLDAWRFSKKVFAIDLIAELVNTDRLLWIDADTVAFAHVPLEFLQRLPPDDADVAFLDRPNYHSECGFIGYNLKSPDTKLFIRRFADLYYSGEVFSLKEWHDSWVFDWMRKNSEEKFGFKIKNHKIPHTNTIHPFVFSELGQYMDHLKGARKKRGLSTEHPRYNRRKG